MKYKKIALIGMMGSGKTTVARALQKKINIEIVDLDVLFEKKYKIAIKEFFEKYSQQEFRQKETELLKEVSKKESFIISTGGGIILSEANRDLLFKNDIYTIYLSASENTIYERIKNDNSRPLLQVENPKEEIKKILNSRIEFYRQANITIITDNKSIEKIVEEIKCAI